MHIERAGDDYPKQDKTQLRAASQNNITPLSKDMFTGVRCR